MPLIDDKGRLAIPRRILRAAHIEPGDEVEVYDINVGMLAVAAIKKKCHVCGRVKGLTPIGTDPQWYLCTTHAAEAVAAATASENKEVHAEAVSVRCGYGEELIYE